MSDTTTKSSGGIGTLGLLGIAFVVLKLCHVIDWSWWWVTCPFWAVPAFVVTAWVFLVLLYVARGLLPKRKRGNG
jgi:phosphoglycerol transferase MdoB-like AlkP superfamily enzyme